MLSVYWAKLGFDAGNAARAEFEYEGIIHPGVFPYVYIYILKRQFYILSQLSTLRYMIQKLFLIVKNQSN